MSVYGVLTSYRRPRLRVRRGVIRTSSWAYPAVTHLRSPRSNWPPPWKNCTDWPSRKLAKESLAGKGGNTKKPLVASPKRTLICWRGGSKPNFKLWRPPGLGKGDHPLKGVEDLFCGP